VYLGLATKHSSESSQVEVANSISGGGFSAYFLCKDYKDEDYQNTQVINFLNKLGRKYEGLHKCVRCRGLTQPILVDK
jgi:hypothetical protein